MSNKHNHRIKVLARAGAVALTFIFLAVMIPPAFSAPTVYFTSINNAICDFTFEYMPVVVNNEPLVSDAVLKAYFKDLRTSWNTDKRTFTVYNSEAGITFELGRGTAFTDDKRYDAACVRYSQGGDKYLFFMTAGVLCEVFGWTLKRVETDYGVMIRLRDSSAIRSDILFADANTNVIREKREAYELEINPPSPTPSTAVTPTPSSRVSPSSAPSVTPTPPSATQSPSPEPEPEPVFIYLTFEGDLNLFTAQTLDALEAMTVNGVKSPPAAFFLTPDSLDENTALARRLSQTQRIGLLLGGDDIVADANEALRAVTFGETRLLRYTGSITDEQRLILEDLGYRVWDAGITCSSGEKTSVAAARVAKAMERQQVLVLSIIQDENTPQLLKELEKLFNSDEYAVTLQRIDFGDRAAGTG